MKFYRFFPSPSDRMGALWALCGIKDAFILEFGPSGTTSFSTSGFSSLNADVNANIFTTHVNEDDITFGSSKRLLAAISEIDKIHSPKEIFILSSALGAVTGTDINGICSEIQEGINARLIPVDTGGFQGDYTLGIRNTISLLCREIVQETKCKNGKYNIIGSQADCFNFSADIEEIKRIMQTYFGMECHAIFSSGCTIEDIRTASESDFNLVIRSEGITGANLLKNRYNQEFICTRPYGVLETLAFIETVETMTGIKPDKIKLDEEISVCKSALLRVKNLTTPDEYDAVISGNYDLVLGIRSLLKEVGVTPIISIINHKIKDYDYISYKKGKILIDPDEDEIEENLADIKPKLVLGDATTIKIAENLGFNNFFQISNPNIGQVKFFNYTPFIGFRGTIYLCEVLCNMIPPQMHIK